MLVVNIPNLFWIVDFFPLVLTFTESEGKSNEHNVQFTSIEWEINRKNIFNLVICMVGMQITCLQYFLTKLK